MLRIATAKWIDADGNAQERTHQSSDDPGAVLAFITGISDDTDNEVTVTIKRERESHDPRR